MTLPNENPFEKVFDKLAELIQFLEKNKHKEPNISHEMEVKLKQLEIKIQAFIQTTKASLLASGLRPEEVDQLLKNPLSKDLPPELRVLINRSMEMKNKTEELRTLAGETSSEPTPPPAQPDDKSPSTPRQRKSKFRRLGGRDDWKPL